MPFLITNTGCHDLDRDAGLGSALQDLQAQVSFAARGLGNDVQLVERQPLARQTFRRHQAVVAAELCMIWDLGGDGPETLGDVA